MAIDPRGADLNRYLQEEPRRSGRDAQPAPLRRGRPRVLRPVRQGPLETFLPRYGGEVLYAGDGGTPLAAEQGQDWDAVLLVRYPSREAFSRMVADPEYQQVTHLRTQALTEAVL